MDKFPQPFLQKSNQQNSGIHPVRSIDFSLVKSMRGRFAELFYVHLSRRSPQTNTGAYKISRREAAPFFLRALFFSSKSSDPLHHKQQNYFQNLCNARGFLKSADKSNEKFRLWANPAIRGANKIFCRAILKFDFSFHRPLYL